MSLLSAEITESNDLDALLSDDVFTPAEPRNLAETGVSPVLIEGLLCKFLLQVGSASGRKIADRALRCRFAICWSPCSPTCAKQAVGVSIRARRQMGDYSYALS